MDRLRLVKSIGIALGIVAIVAALVVMAMLVPKLFALLAFVTVLTGLFVILVEFIYEHLSPSIAYEEDDGDEWTHQ